MTKKNLFYFKNSVVILIILLAIFISSATKASNNRAPLSSLPGILKADKVDGDQSDKILKATGNVELKKDGSTLFADQLSYDKNNRNIEALGNIKIKNYDIGNVLAKKANVKSDFKSGEFINATIIFKDGSYIKSPQIIRNSELETVFNRTIFSICPNDDIVSDNFLAGNDREAISFTSRTTTINKADESITTRGGVIRIYDVPVFYTPYLRTNLPSSERKSGFLHPSYIQTTNLGKGFGVPYYFNIAPDKDLLSTLKYHPLEKHLLLNNQYRQLLEKGFYNINLELANNQPIKNNLVGSNSNKNTQNIRWNLISGGNYNLQNNLEVNFSINSVGDKNYLRDYQNQFIGYTTSEVDLDYIKNREYASIKTVKIQELEINLDEREEPFAFPINYYTESKPQGGLLNQTYGLLFNSTVITRRSGLQYRRLTAKPEVRLPYNLSGNLFEISGNVQGDVYNLENQYIAKSNNNNFDNFASNYRPEVAAQWSLPLVGKYNTNTIIIEPLTSIAVSSYKNGQNKIPNEDTNDTELTQNNLFLSDRLTGFDRNESGKRVSYGFKSSLFNDTLGQFNLSLGQGWRDLNKTQDVSIRGFYDNKKSNIVGGMGYKSPKIFSIVYSFQLNESSYRNDVNEVNTGLNFGRVSIASNYILIRKVASNADMKKQVSLNIGFNITKKIVADANLINNLVTKATIYKKYSLTYNGCCVSYEFAFSENNPTALTKPNKTYGIKFAIKNL